MLNFLVETKNEYTTHLINILNPLIFEGMQSIYKDALRTANESDVLKTFQTYLRQIPKWNQTMIEKETSRIINSSQSYGWLNDLIKATIKSNLIILLYNPTCKKQSKVDSSYYMNIKTTDFIHKIYIECAREIWNNPYLLFHEYPPLEIKRNQRDCMNIIKECIKEAIRKLLPVKHILKIYLGEDIEMNNLNDEVDKVMSDVEKNNLERIIKKDLAENNNINNPMEIEYNSPIKPIPEQLPNNTLVGGNKLSTNSEEKTIGSRILNIINSPISESSSSIKGGSRSSSTSSLVKDFESALNPTRSLDDKLKHILKKDLATDSDLETSLNYSQETNKNDYQEIFSNSNIQPSKEVGNKDKDKKKFFNNYMQF